MWSPCRFTTHIGVGEQGDHKGRPYRVLVVYPDIGVGEPGDHTGSPLRVRLLWPLSEHLPDFGFFTFDLELRI